MKTEEKLNKCAFLLGLVSGGVASMIDEASEDNNLKPSLINLQDILMKQCQDIFYGDYEA
jgi:hypothetical protein